MAVAQWPPLFFYKGFLMGRKRKKRNPYLGNDPLPDGLVSPEEIKFRHDMLGEFDDDEFSHTDKPAEKEDEEPVVDHGPKDEFGLTAADHKVIPPEMLVTMDVGDDEGQHFSLQVGEVTVAVDKRGMFRIPVLKFKVSMALTRYYMVDKEPGGAKEPAIDHAPLTEPFYITLPLSFLPLAVRKYPDMVSPALATKILMQMLNKYPWSMVKPAPKKNIERLIPDHILQKMRGGPSGL